MPSSTTASPQVNSVTVSTTTPDPSSANNGAQDSDTVTTSADVSVTKTDGVTSVTAGLSSGSYTIVVHSGTTSLALNSRVVDTSQPGFSQGAITTTQGTCALVGTGP